MKLRVEMPPVSFWCEWLTGRLARAFASCVQAQAVAQDIAGAKMEHCAFGDSDMIRSGLFHVLTDIAGLARAAGRGM